jgi:hypothetical protein
MARIAIKDNFDEVFIFHAKSFSEMLAWSLKFSADDDPAEIEEDSAYAHLLFFVAFFPFADSVEVVFFPFGDDVEADFAADLGLAGDFFSSAGLGAGLDSA